MPPVQTVIAAVISGSAGELPQNWWARNPASNSSGRLSHSSVCRSSSSPALGRSCRPSTPNGCGWVLAIVTTPLSVLLLDLEARCLLVAGLLDLRGEAFCEQRPRLGGLPTGVLVRLSRPAQCISDLLR